MSDSSWNLPLLKVFAARVETRQVPPPTREILMIPAQRIASPATAPASLTQAGNNPSGQCPECGSDRVTALAMTLTDGTPVRFASCHRCEHRHWSHEGRLLSFTDVIARATKQKV
jgi:DNA-directed RNA polymerase subunit M/transcription elongation factor TFIIS